jgi:SpoIID/LytB domain protein
VRNMSMDQYLFGLAEMPSSWHLEALKAQAVTGRSFAALKVGGSSSRLYDLLATVQDQVYTGWAKEGEPTWGARWVQAVYFTSGRVLRVGNQTVSGNYSSSSGGHTEDSGYVWSSQPSHLRGVPDPADNVSPRHRWSRSYTLAEIGSWFGVSNVRDVRITGSVGKSGRVDKATVQIIGSTTKQVTGNQFRFTVNSRVPDSRALWSTKFRVAQVSGAPSPPPPTSPPPSQSGFPDVPRNAYYAEAVSWLVDKGITDGVGNTGRYQPHTVVTRAQMAAFMWRMMGRPTGYPHHGFPDVPRGSYYDAAVRYLRATGVTDGVGNTGRYGPHQAVTRSEMATFLHRLSGLRAPGQRHPFPDVPRGSYYDRAVSWAFQYRITDGVGNTGRYQPLDPVTRAQMAAFLHRLASRSGAWSNPLPPTRP